MSVDRHIARRLRGKRLALGLTVDEVARVLGVSPDLFGEYERGLTRIPDAQLARLGEFLNVPLNYFLPENPGAERRYPRGDLER